MVGGKLVNPNGTAPSRGGEEAVGPWETGRGLAMDLFYGPTFCQKIPREGVAKGSEIYLTIKGEHDPPCTPWSRMR